MRGAWRRRTGFTCPSKIMYFRKILLSAVILFGSGCRTTDGSDDWSWLGGVVGGILGFGLFFLVTFLTSRGRL